MSPAVASVKHLQLMAQGQRGIVRRATAPDQYIMTDILPGPAPRNAEEGANQRSSRRPSHQSPSNGEVKRAGRPRVGRARRSLCGLSTRPDQRRQALIGPHELVLLANVFVDSCVLAFGCSFDASGNLAERATAARPRRRVCAAVARSRAARACSWPARRRRRGESTSARCTPYP